MPKVRFEISKADKELACLEIVKARKKVSTKEVVVACAARFHISEEDRESKTFYNAIQSTLQGLAARGKLVIIYEDMVGHRLVTAEEIEAAQRKQAYYAIPGGDLFVSGIGELHRFGGDLLIPAKSRLHWRVVSPAVRPTEACLRVILWMRSDSVKIVLPWDEVSAELIIGRNSQDGEGKPSQKIIDKLPRNTAYLLWQDDGISRYKANGRLGHAKLHWDEAGKVRVSDLGSTAGTEVAQLSEGVLSQLSTFLPGGMSLQSTELNRRVASLEWQRVEQEGATFQLPAAIKLGTCFMIVA